MTILFLVLIIIASVAIGLFILIQNPKGGGLAGNIAGFNTQFMGVKQTTDVLEKGTWVMAIAIALLCLFSAFFIPEGKSSGRDPVNARPATSAPAPASGSPLQSTPPAK
ncbi:preprotein translocase subunit SecG [Niastella caeni]|uniref:Protein-export membrane protein SecG n=1 Tax=Niastella caeni TaxID=2569763 RepID=A0A4S8HIJ1_9BACT|nr:preprotein translocase subunit SecG [Niastella caeni]THU34835.1 preprotein translocase subunit SecG [Niastella caeni]